MALAALSAVIQVSRLAGAIAFEIRRVVQEDWRLGGKLKNGLRSLEADLRLAVCMLAEKEKNLGSLQEARIVEIYELLYDVEDYVQQLWMPGGYGSILVFLGVDKRPEQLDTIDHFRDRIKRLMELKCDECGEDEEIITQPAPYLPESDLLGIARPKAEILKMLTQSGEDELRIMCLVGCRGVGKTALARALYDHMLASEDYESISWVVATDCRNSIAIEQKILDSIQTQSDMLDKNIAEVLAHKRFFIVIDDLQEKNMWHDIKKVFPKNNKSNAILVTTNVESVASNCRGQVYVVSGLSDAESKKLFWEKLQVSPSKAAELALGRIFETCEGLPRAVLSVASHFLEQGKLNLTIKDCEEEGLSFGRYLTGQDASISFDEMRKSLSNSYNCLPDYVHKMCLLSIGMFPKGHRVRTKSLVRELIAVGLIAGGEVRLEKESVAARCLWMLRNQGLIKPVTIGINYEVKRFQMDGIMLEFVIHKSAHKNFATLIHSGERIPKSTDSNLVHPARRLSVDGGIEQGKSKMLVEEVGLSAVRWLRICHTKVFLDLKNCVLLRVLDLEGSTGIDSTVMEKICELQFLKYLGLRGSDVDMIPRIIKKLKCLETLDCRETKVTKLPIEVFNLPQLSSLFGKFEPPRLSKKQKPTLEHLQTLAGLVIKDWQTFDQIMLQAGWRLKKLKIWCETPHPRGISSFRERIQERFIAKDGLSSLAVDSADLCKEFISFLKDPCCIRSIKLHGALDHLPDSAVLRGLSILNELHLFNSGLSCEKLSVLQELPCLVYLKLAERIGFADGSKFVTKRGGFGSLKRLCFEAPKLPEIAVENGGMICLTSFDLLCPEYCTLVPVLPHPFLREAESIESWAGFIGLSYLPNLKEITLHEDTTAIKLQNWKKASIFFNSRPHVKRQGM